MDTIKIKKRNGELVEYDGNKIILAIKKAMAETDRGIDEDIAKNIEIIIYDIVHENDAILEVESIQDEIEELLASYDRFDVAKTYILYRNKHAELREKGWEMTDLQKDIYEQKYRWNSESFDGFLERVSGGNHNLKKLIRDKKFLFAGRILANRKLNELENRKITLSNCYVVSSPEDNLESIFEVAKKLARTFSYGGGCGIDISKLRPNNSKVNNNAVTTSGATSFMELYSVTTGIIGQKNRRGALMISIDINHPDIEEFVDIKQNLDNITKANISIFANNRFFNAVEKKEMFETKFIIENTGEVITKQIDANKLMDKISFNSWDVAEPALLFKSRIDSYHLLQFDDEFEYASVNPCAEEPLPAGGSCLLGSLNLANFVKDEFSDNAYFDFDDFKDAIQKATIGLNEVLDEGLPLHPLQEQRDSVANYRQIGLGIMGLADMFIKLKVRYGSNESLFISEQVAKFMINTTLQQSAMLAKEYGTYPKYKEQEILQSDFLYAVATKETYQLIKKYGLRNSQLTTIAPTGSLSTMWGISGGIEPIFNISYTRRTQTLNDGDDTYYKVYTPIAKQYMDMNNILKEEDLPDFFITAMTLNPMERVDMQSTWQKYIDASISSTVNLPNDATVEDVKNIYMYSWEKGLKGVTIYRDGCRRGGILINSDKEKQKIDFDKMSIDELEDEIIELQMLKSNKVSNKFESNPNACPLCGGEMIHTGGCAECRDCGYSPCSI